MRRLLSLAGFVMLVAVLFTLAPGGVIAASSDDLPSFAPLVANSPAAQGGNVVTVRNFSFTPSSISVEAGESVTWNNTQGFHNVVATDGSFSSGDPANAPWTYSHQFDTVGTFSYICEVHPTMTGTVEVLPRTVRSAAIVMRSRTFPAGNLVLGIVVVRDSSNQPVPGAVVEGHWTLPNGSTVDQTVTANASGLAIFFTFGGSGTYTLTVDNITAGGYVFDPNQGVIEESIVVP